MFMRKLLFLSAAFIVLLATACSKKTEVLDLGNIGDYNLQQPGKVIVYKLDSLLYINFGQKDTVVSYFIKDSVMAKITDNLGRPAYRIFRYIRKAATDAWQSNNTFMTVPSDNSVEYVENNQRYLKLKQPLRDGYSWKGNTYIDTYSLNSEFKYLDDWDYVYENIDATITISGISVPNTITVNQRDEVIGNITDLNSYSEKNLGIEKYAKGIGLVYRNFLHREYQPPTPGRLGYKTGYGVTITMISHN
jgi:hypothetical protein